PCPEGGKPRPRYHRISPGTADRGGPKRRRTCRRLSRGVLAAARTGDYPAAERAAAKARLRGEGRAGRPFVLWLGRNIQYYAARHRKKVARAQSRDYREIAT